MKIINKTMDLNDLNTIDARVVIDELVALDKSFLDKGCNITSWYGEYDPSDYYKKLNLLNRGYDYVPILNLDLDIKYPNFLLWEIYWVFSNINVKPKSKLLDIGGSCSLFSFYLASKGVNVVAIDKNPKIVDEANRVASIMNLPYKAVCADAEEYLNLTKEKYDYITSICVFEHIELNKRKRIIKVMDKHLNKNGVIAFTFDYKNPSRFVNINNFNDIKNQFLCNKKLLLKGNSDFYDNNINYLVHPFYKKPIFWKYKINSIRKKNFKLKELFKTKLYNDYTFGAIFLVKK